MNSHNEALVTESLRMIEAHLERIADVLEALVPVLVPPPAPVETPPNPGPLEELAAKQKETYDHSYSDTHRNFPHFHS
jgi:hypothetical protein